MYAFYVILFLGAFFLALFTFTFAAGSLIHLVGLFMEGWRAVRKPKVIRTVAAQPKPAARPASHSKAPQAAIYVDASAAYART